MRFSKMILLVELIYRTPLLYIFLKIRNRIDRFTVIFDELTNFVKLKDYFCNKPTEFGFYIYTNKLVKLIEFTSFKEFIPNLADNRRMLKEMKFTGKDIFDLSEIFEEAFSYLNKLSRTSSSNETIIRYILFYNRSDIPSMISNEKEHNLINFIRLTNFYFDIIFLRKKMNSDEDKKVLTEVFSSLTMAKPKFWYAFENSGNIPKLKYFMNLLLANPNQRVKLSEIDKTQKNIEELVKNYADQ
jgi:hypothetical protein